MSNKIRPKAYFATNDCSEVRYSSVTQAVRSPVLKSVYETYMPSTC